MSGHFGSERSSRATRGSNQKARDQYSYSDGEPEEDEWEQLRRAPSRKQATMIPVDDGLLQGARGQFRQQKASTCSDCESPLDNYEMANHRSLNGRCGTCHDLFRRGNYCPACQKTWTATDRDMVGCDTCSFWVHASCDRLAKKALESGEHMDYFCPQCRKVKNIHNRLSALRQAENQVRQGQPVQPRGAFQLFAEEISKQYHMQVSAQQMSRMVGSTWRQLDVAERAPYEHAANNELMRYNRDLQSHQEVKRRYSELRLAAQQDGIIDEDGQPIKVPKLAMYRPHSASNASVSPPGRGGNLGTLRSSGSGSMRATSTGPSSPRGGGQRPGSGSLPRNGFSSTPRATTGSKRTKRESSPDYVPQPSKKKREKAPTPYFTASAEPGAEPVAKQEPLDLPEELQVICNGKQGTLILARQRVICSCNECSKRAGGSNEYSCTQFEQHCGAGSAKKWKASLRIVAGSVPEVPSGGPTMPVGKWMEQVGMDVKASAKAHVALGPSVTTRNQLPGAAPSRKRQYSLSPSPPPRTPPPPRVVKKEEKDTSGLFEPWMEIHKGRFKPMKVRWAGDRCSVCDSDVDFDFDQLVSCDQCGITVHQTCYGVQELPGEDDLWLCRACEHKGEGEEYPQCCLCPVTGGALKQTTEAGLWCHVACMHWIPEVTVEDLHRMEPVSHIRSIQKERWDLNCSICKQKAGAKIQCSTCYTAYHPLCGRVAGLHMEILDPEGPNDGVRLVSYCAKHCVPKPQATGVRLVSKEEEENQKVTGGDGNGLWNAQLFPPPEVVPVPECPSGCARVEPLQSLDWVRISHGPGNGNGSTAGFWIPKKPPPALYQPKYKIPKPAKRRSAGVPAPRGRPSKLFKAKVEKNGGDGMDAMHGVLGEVPVAELMALPEGVTEEVPVQCSGRSALLLIRTQKILYGGQEISASRFEALCGKGDAKKWKSSLYLEVDSQPVMAMQDWLNEKKLDRKALANLASNVTAVEVYQEFCTQELHAVMRGMLDAVCEEAQPGEMQEAAQTMEQAPLVENATQENGVSASKTAESAAPEDVPMTPTEDTAPPTPEPEMGSEPEITVAQPLERDVDTPPLEARDEDMHDVDETEKSEVDKPEGAVGITPETPPPQATSEKPQAEEPARQRPTAEPAVNTKTAATAVSPPAPPAGSGPASAVGQRCEVFFAEDKEWYKAFVRGYDKANKLHNLWYFIDGEGEWIDLVEEDRSGRVRWEKPAMSANLREAKEGKKPPAIVKDARNGAAAPGKEAAVGWRIAVWWVDDACFYHGSVQHFDPDSGRHRVLYDDGDEEHLMLSAEHVRWDKAPANYTPQPATPSDPTKPSEPLPPPEDKPSQPASEPVAPAAPVEPSPVSTQPPVPQIETRVQNEESQEEAAHAAAERAKKAASAPESVAVICNFTLGTYLTHRTAVQMNNGQIVSPTEFERISGKAASKKWKASIRIDKGGGSPGITIGDWLVDQGLDAPKAPRLRSDGGAARQHHRHNLAMRSAATQRIMVNLPASSKQQGHRDSCMCIICKQARRTGRAWSGMVGGHAPIVYAPAAAGQKFGRHTAAIEPRFGKRAYIRCTGQYVRGPIRKQAWELPATKTYTAQEWEAEHPEEADPDPTLEAPAQPPSDAQDGSEQAEQAEQSKQSAMIKAEYGSKSGRKALTVKERLEVCQATERQRLTFCKSGIHGWGLIARLEMKQDSMIIEYRGETLRRAMADEREKDYRVKDMDCYLFNINDDKVVDATMKGTIGRFTNHCCSPSMYAKVVDVDNQPHVVFFARQDIRIGQELTYDYRFKEEEGDNKMTCQCGAPNCRGFMN